MTAAYITMKELCLLRNRVVYDGIHPNAEEMKKKIIQLTKECEVRMKGCMWNTVEDLLILKKFGMKCRKVKTSKIQECSFSFPTGNQILLCCDGASGNNPGEAGYGFVGRNNAGTVLIVVAGGMGIGTNFLAEVFAVINACEWDTSEGFFQLCIRTYSMSVIHSFTSGKVPWYVQTRWNKIVEVLISFTFIHSYREINFSADGMEKMGATLSRGEKRIFLSRPPFMIHMENPDVTYYIFG
ncbi:uncharacterized protein LOC113360423 [Papaver somniferum]|uniref:uncharacterized protein LOC113360423 n=1 Tax=Papaver somniferum TaxID=3469 RepID=UPI000E6F9E4E|nr:uncharacterized protein LOC113360423 [Papaver somniferum]